ncbi:MAG: hypothetical protein KDD89_13835, partial [Anaerolineales bacterium]|nr:hypothetical protein [Anaerolineales bacterium]
MKRWMPPFFLLLSLPLLLIACQSNPAPAAGTFGGGEEANANADASATEAESPASWSPVLNLSASSGGPNSQITLIGTEFPPDQLVLIRLGEADELSDETPVYAQTASDGLGVFELDLTLPTLWPPDNTAVPTTDTTLTIQANAPAVGDAAPPAHATFTLNYRDAFQTLSDDTAGFTLQIPSAWEVSDSQTTPLGHLRLFGPAPVQAGNPSTNLLLVAEAETLSAVQAAEQLLCGGGCADQISFTAVELGNTPAQQAIIGGDGLPQLTWYFVEHAGRLIYFTLNDPTTLTTLSPLAQTLTLGQAVAIQPSPTPTEPPPTATPEPEPTAEPTLEPTPEITATVAVTEAIPTPATTETAISRDEGPLETTVSFLLDVTRQEITPATLERLTPALRDRAQTFTAVLDLLELDAVFTGIDAGRINAPEVIVRAVLTTGNATEVRLFTLLLEEDGAWRIIDIAPEAEVATPEATPTEPETETVT